MFRSMLSVALALTVFVGGSLFAAEKPVKGTITKVDKEGGNIVLTVSIAAKKKDTSTEKNEKKFTVKSDTKVEKVTGKKDDQKHTDAKTDDLKEGVAITLTVSGDKVEKIEINGGKKSK